jgi:hypothetical protein
VPRCFLCFGVCVAAMMMTMNMYVLDDSLCCSLLLKVLLPLLLESLVYLGFLRVCGMAQH